MIEAHKDYFINNSSMMAQENGLPLEEKSQGSVC